MMTRLTAVTALVLLAACGDDTGGAGGSGGGPTTATGAGGDPSTTTATTAASTSQGSGGAGGAGGGPDLDKDPAEVTSADDCFYDGGDGGADLVTCDWVSVAFSEPLEVAELSFTITTSEGDTFTPAALGDENGPFIAALDGGTYDEGGLPTEGTIAGLSVSGVASPPHYAPTWVEVEVRIADQVVGTARYEDLEYACIAKTSDDWCWAADPVTLSITPPAEPAE